MATTEPGSELAAIKLLAEAMRAGFVAFGVVDRAQAIEIAAGIDKAFRADAHAQLRVGAAKAAVLAALDEPAEEFGYEVEHPPH